MGLGSPTSLLVGSTRPPVPLVVVPAKTKFAKAADHCSGGRAHAGEKWFASRGGRR